MNSFISDFNEAGKVLESYTSNKKNFEDLKAAGELMIKALRKGNKIISCGNGGSMSDAMHFAEELSGRFRENRPSIPAIAISDPSHISCVANDFGYDYVFSRYIEGLGQTGDVLLAISTSGNSANCINAIEVAIAKGMTVIGLTGKTGGKMAELCHVELRVPHMGYSDRVQEVHIKIIHSLINYIEQNLNEE
jgi:D-sedoheptulose 7-phosphate isomerase